VCTLKQATLCRNTRWWCSTEKTWAKHGNQTRARVSWGELCSPTVTNSADARTTWTANSEINHRSQRPADVTICQSSNSKVKGLLMSQYIRRAEYKNYFGCDTHRAPPLSELKIIRVLSSMPSVASKSIKRPTERSRSESESPWRPRSVYP
jgi:hypothetical protein